MHAICAEMGTADPVAALQQVVSTVFAGTDESVARLRESIISVNFKPGATNAELARHSGISRGHLQRRRAAAVVAIAQYARGIMERRLVEPYGVCSTTPAPDACFEREAAAFVAARERCDVLEMRSIAGSMIRLARTLAQHGRGLACRADANVRLGRCDEARQRMEMIPPLASALIAAKLALLSGDWELAEMQAQAAARQLERSDLARYHCETVLSAARLQRAAQWSPPIQAQSLPERSWERMAMDVERARHCLQARQTGHAEDLAGSALERADRCEYRDLGARAAAVLHATAVLRGRANLAREWRAQAVLRLLPTQDRVAATGLFLPAPNGERIGVDALLCAALYERLCIVVPQMHGENLRQRAAVCSFLTALLDWSFSGSAAVPRLGTLASLVSGSDSAFAHYARTLRGAIVETVALVLTALSGLTWGRAYQRIDDAFDAGLAQLRPAEPRTIPVVVSRRPLSQLAVADHLRLDDRTPNGDGYAAESDADLCVRLVSL